jgi:TRAP-type C4-dicarboxylate transport system substrate-binding protein
MIRRASAPLTCLVALVLVICACSTGFAATTLLYASPYSPNHPFSRADQVWMRWVEEHSNHDLLIHAQWSGALLSSDQSMLELRHGIADIGLITPIYIRGGVQLIRAQTGFYGGAKTFQEQVALYACLNAASPEFARELSGLKILAVQGGTLPGILTRSEHVTTLADLRGLRIRVPTELLGVLRDLGADPVNMPMGEVYSALAKGVLDGVVAPADTLKSLHFAEVAKHYWQLEIPRGAYPARAMALRRWNTLSPQEQDVLERSTSVWEDALAQQTSAAVQAGETAGRLAGVEFTTASAADQHRFDVLYERDAERNARSLARDGIDAMGLFAYARTLAAGIESTGEIHCQTALPASADAAR